MRIHITPQKRRLVSEKRLILVCSCWLRIINKVRSITYASWLSFKESQEVKEIQYFYSIWYLTSICMFYSFVRYRRAKQVRCRKSALSHPVEGAHTHIIYFTPSSVSVNNMQYIIKDKMLLTNLYYMYLPCWQDLNWPKSDSSSFKAETSLIHHRMHNIHMYMRHTVPRCAFI